MRRQDLWLDSFYREILGWEGRRETRDIDTFYHEEGKFWLDYSARLSPWIEMFGKENVILRSYDDAIAAPGILTDFLTYLGVKAEPPLVDQSTRRVNTSLPPSLTDLMRAVNSLPGLAAKHKTVITRSFSECVSQELDKGTLLSDELWKEIAGEYGAINKHTPGVYQLERANQLLLIL